MKLFGEDFYGFVGSKEYDEYFNRYLEEFDSDEDPSYSGILIDEVEEKKKELASFLTKVKEAEAAVFPGCVVFNKPGFGRVYPAFCFDENGDWKVRDVHDSDLLEMTADFSREVFYRNPMFGILLDKLGDLGFPLSKENDFERISSFASFADRLPKYIEMIGGAGIDIHQRFRFSERRTSMTAYDVFQKNIFQMNSRNAISGTTAGISSKERNFSAADKARYYSRMAEKEEVDFVKDRYAEKAEYWKKVDENAEILPEMEASCGPNHKWNAADNYINAKHKLDKNTDPGRDEELKFRLQYWETAAREEKKVNDMVKAIERNMERDVPSYGIER